MEIQNVIVDHGHSTSWCPGGSLTGKGGFRTQKSKWVAAALSPLCMCLSIHTFWLNLSIACWQAFQLLPDAHDGPNASGGDTGDTNEPHTRG